jgi:fermentation-respiration switch protein FrsA (DUF1100 family)
VLYGYSIGSGPSVALVHQQIVTHQASSPNYIVGGLIIHSGLSSGLRILFPGMRKTPYYDVFPNVELIQNVQCPVFILHGTADNEVSIQHAHMLADKTVRLHSLWLVENAGHSNIDTEDEWRNQYFKRLRIFLMGTIFL